MTLIRKVFYFLFFILLLVPLGCSVKKNTASSRAFHNLTSHYNIFFNARESYKSGVKKAWKQTKIDYTKEIPVFPVENKETASAITPEMERVIKKASKLITYHSITAKPKKKSSNLTPKEKEFYSLPEYNKWVDDSYLLMGKAQYLKNDLASALVSFNYIIHTKYPDQDVILEAMLWAAKTYDRMKDYQSAEEILKELQKEEGKIPSSLLPEYYRERANHFLLQGKTNEATDEMKKVLENSRKKNDKALAAFLLGQLNEKAGNMADAVKYYRMIFHMNPPYEMAFNAHIRIAEDSQDYAENLKEVKKDLRKLLRDEKNKEYRDQIYYAFGEIALKEGKADEAIKDFKKSALYSVSNDEQKGLSYLSIADIYFKQDDYNGAQMYYDSAVAVLPGNYPGYEDYKIKSQSLNRLVRYTHEVTLQDSLQHLAALPEKKRLAVIDGIIEKVVEEEKEKAKQKEGQNYSYGQALQTEMRYQSEINRSGQWYFYNPAALSFGRSEFKKRWGNRKLEDNWRRKNKAAVTFESTAQAEDTASAKTVIQAVQRGNKKSRSYYLRQIPLNDSMMAVSNKQLQEGLFESSMIFYNELKNYDRAISNLERLVKDFPESSYLLPAYFTLYKLYKDKNETTRADKYKNLIIEKFPESEQAKVLKDPLYLKKLNEKREAAENEYQKVYNLFTAGRYREVIRYCDQAIGPGTDEDLKSKYMFLRAVSVGKTTDPATFKEALKAVADSVPDKEIASRCRILIGYLNQEHPVLKQKEIEKTARIIYHFNMSEKHLMVLFVNNRTVNINQLKFEIINFNTDQYPQTEFDVKTNKEIFRDTTVITIRPLGDLTKAREYEKAFDQYADLGRFVKDPDVEIFLFSESNFETFRKNKSLDPYRVFYKKYYLR